jgi:hypothetical protein
MPAFNTSVGKGVDQMSQRYGSMRMVALLGGVLALVLIQGSALAQPFNLVQMTNVTPPPPGTGIHGIALVGSQWFMANFNSGWNVYDLNYNQVGTVTTTPNTGAPRGLVLNTNTGNIFLGDYSTNTIHEVTPTGNVLNSFPSTGSQLNALAYNPTNDHLYALHYQGQVIELTTAGGVVGSFSVGGTWTGAAYDSNNNTLLMMNSTPDQVLEYTTGGVLVDTPLPGDAVNGNGQGLHYDSTTGILHATGQYGDIGVWERTVSTPVESTTWGAIKGLYNN